MRESRGFTLVEVAILVVIVGLISVGGLTIVGAIFDSRRSQTTGERLDLIEQALQSYVEEFSCLPCPTDGSLSSTGADNNFGRSFDTGGLVGGNCTATACRLIDAVVPWRTLGLSEEFATDGWGDRIRYYVGVGTPCTAAAGLQDTAGMDRCGTTYPTGNVTVNDNDSATTITNAAYVLVSSGPDKSLALTSSTGVTTNDIYGQTGGGGGQDENSDDDAVFAFGDFRSLSGVAHFDDIVRFKSAEIMVQLCGPGTCQNPE